MKKITLRDSIRWNKESFVLFKKTPNQSLMLSLAYLFIFMLLPSMPIVQVFSIASILIWPIFLVFAAITGVFVYFWFHDLKIAILIGAAMIVNLTVAGLAGIAIPVTLNKMKIDPAVSATVFVTTVTDVVGFFAFLGIASLFV